MRFLMQSTQVIEWKDGQEDDAQTGEIGNTVADGLGICFAKFDDVGWIERHASGFVGSLYGPWHPACQTQRGQRGHSCCWHWLQNLLQQSHRPGS